jgi:hypothetical protein
VIAGYVSSPIIPLIVGAVLLIGTLFVLRNSKGSYKVPDSANFNRAAAK